MTAHQLLQIYGDVETVRAFIKTRTPDQCTLSPNCPADAQQKIKDKFMEYEITIDKKIETKKNATEEGFGYRQDLSGDKKIARRSHDKFQQRAKEFGAGTLSGGGGITEHEKLRRKQEAERKRKEREQKMESDMKLRTENSKTILYIHYFDINCF